MSTALEAMETEQDLITAAQRAVSNCNWTVGECAAQWTKRYARGRTDADFGTMVGLSGDQVYQRRRVWETFADVREGYARLKWSHFYVALTWNDSSECLGWAQDNEATVAEMRAWRRMQHGEDLTVEAAAELDAAAMSLDFGEPVLSRQSEYFGEDDGTGSSDSLAEALASESRTSVVSGAGSDGPAPYAPFRKDAASPPPRDDAADEFTPTRMNPEQTFRKMTSALERCTRILTEEVLAAFPELPEKVRLRFQTAVENLNDRTSRLS